MADSSDPQKIRGAGDVVAKITDSLGIPKCSACSRRQEFLNQHIPFPKFSEASQGHDSTEMKKVYDNILKWFKENKN